MRVPLLARPSGRGTPGSPAEPAGPPGPHPAGLDLLRVVEDLLARGESDLYPKVMRVVERALLARVLQETHGHQGHASERLGLNRSTLRYKLRDLGLSVDRVVGDLSAPPQDSGPDDPDRPAGRTGGQAKG